MKNLLQECKGRLFWGTLLLMSLLIFDRIMYPHRCVEEAKNVRTNSVQTNGVQTEKDKLNPQALFEDRIRESLKK